VEKSATEKNFASLTVDRVANWPAGYIFATGAKKSYEIIHNKKLQG
jgi:hypothetical protein